MPRKRKPVVSPVTATVTGFEKKPKPEDYDPVFPLWRIRRPGTNQVYNSDTAEWVELGSGFYSVFTNKQKVSRFWDDMERNWEAFGWPIPLYDDDEVTSDEPRNGAA